MRDTPARRKQCSGNARDMQETSQSLSLGSVGSLAKKNPPLFGRLPHITDHFAYTKTTIPLDLVLFSLCEAGKTVTIQLTRLSFRWPLATAKAARDPACERLGRDRIPSYQPARYKFSWFRGAAPPATHGATAASPPPQIGDHPDRTCHRSAPISRLRPPARSVGPPPHPRFSHTSPSRRPGDLGPSSTG